MSAAEETPKGIAPGPVTEWLAANVPGLRPPLRFALIAGGHSNLTYAVSDAAGRKLVVRRPPLGAVLATAHDMGREHRIISALARTGVPVPPALGLCTDAAVNGAPFYVMAFVEGVVLDLGSTVEEHVPKLDDRRALGRHVIEVLARLHGVDVDAIGLGDLGRREGYVPRQLKRWRTQWEQSKTRELPAMEEVYEALSSRIPAQRGSGIVHGDYRLGNMLTGTDARIAAVLDWELCTLGHPLADFSYHIAQWRMPAGVFNGLADADLAELGIPTEAEYANAYCRRTGRKSIPELDWYLAYNVFRLAAILQGIAGRVRDGTASNAQAAQTASAVKPLAEIAWKFAVKAGARG
jgi:aminoglycoside phosphotransferase (APT) family kinase protein